MNLSALKELPTTREEKKGNNLDFGSKQSFLAKDLTPKVRAYSRIKYAANVRPRAEFSPIFEHRMPVSNRPARFTIS